MLRCWLVGSLAFVFVALTACGGGDEEAPQPVVTAQPTSWGEATPVSTPIVTGNLLESPEKGYSVRFPEGWTPAPHFLPGPDFWVDAFFAPQEVKGLQPNIAVTCEQLPEGMALQEYLDNKVKVVKEVIKVEPELDSRQVAGQEARQLRFARTGEQPQLELATPEAPWQLEKTEVVFITDRCGWDIALTAPYEERANYRELFDEFLESFLLLP